jgi:hypothetical protein
VTFRPTITQLKKKNNWSGSAIGVPRLVSHPA